MISTIANVVWSLIALAAAFAAALPTVGMNPPLAIALGLVIASCLTFALAGIWL